MPEKDLNTCLTPLILSGTHLYFSLCLFISISSLLCPHIHCNITSAHFPVASTEASVPHNIPGLAHRNSVSIVQCDYKIFTSKTNYSQRSRAELLVAAGLASLTTMLVFPYYVEGLEIMQATCHNWFFIALKVLLGLLRLLSWSFPRVTAFEESLPMLTVPQTNNWTI